MTSTQAVFTAIDPSGNSTTRRSGRGLGTAGSAGNVVRGIESFDGFTPQQLRAVERENALALFPRLKDG